MSLLAFGLVYAASMLLVAAVAYDEGRQHAGEDATRSYNEGHSDGFDDGWQANEEVHRTIQSMGHGARW